MLGKLLKTIKSEKSSSQAPETKQQSNSNSSFSSVNPPIHSYSLPSNLQVLLQQEPSTLISKIQYFTLPALPPLIPTILSCPISCFHLLPFGNRRVKEIDLSKHPFPEYLNFLKPLLARELPNYNHLLVNYYPPGVGIMPHFDGPAYCDKVVVLSLGGPCVIRFEEGYQHGEANGRSQQEEENLYKLKESAIVRLLLQTNSIHIFQNNAYTSYLHGIQNYKSDSILIAYDPTTKNVENSNIGNYHILSAEMRNTIEGAIGEVCGEVKQVEKGSLRVARVHDNEEFTHIVDVIRGERVSVTIRHRKGI